MISNLELKKQVKAINRQTKKEIALFLYDRWLYLLTCSDIDSSVISICLLYCEEIYSFILGCSISSVHDLFIDIKDENKDHLELLVKRNLL